MTYCKKCQKDCTECICDKQNSGYQDWRDIRIRELEAEVERLRKLIGEAEAALLYCLPEKPHQGPCTPESGCDGLCMEWSAACALIEKLREAADAAKEKP